MAHYDIYARIKGLWQVLGIKNTEIFAYKITQVNLKVLALADFI